MSVLFYVECEGYHQKPEEIETSTSEVLFRPFVIGGVNAEKNEFPHMVKLSPLTSK